MKKLAEVTYHVMCFVLNISIITLSLGILTYLYQQHVSCVDIINKWCIIH